MHDGIGDTVAVDRFQYGVGLFQRSRHWFFGDDGDAGLGCLNGVFGVHGVRCGDRYRVDLGFGEHVAIVGISLRRRHLKRIASILKVVGDRVGDRNDVHCVRQGEIYGNMVDAHDTAASNQTQAYRFCYLPLRLRHLDIGAG